MRFDIAWILLALLWLGLSGFYDPIHLVFGAVSVTIVSALSWRHLTGDGPIGRGVGRVVRLVIYAPWLLWQITLANLDVTLRIFGLRPIDPCVIRFTPELESDFGRVTLANSITLTPGTVTVEIGEDGEFIVHALNCEAADEVLARAMEHKAKAIEGGSDA